MAIRSVEFCKYNGCGEYQWARGYCSPHYHKLRKSGLLKQVRQHGTMRERFEKQYTVNPDTECWEWNGAMHRDGYGLISEPGRYGKILRAHRYAYQEFVGEIPKGVKVLHECDVRNCVNYERHLFLGTQKVNMQDCAAKGRTAGQLGKIKHKVSDKMATNIRIMYARGYSIEKLAEIYSLHVSTVNGIVKGLAHLQVD